LQFGLVHIGADVRLASHLGSVALWGGGGLGLDLSLIDSDAPVDGGGIGLGLNLDAGADFLVRPGLALSFGMTWHPGFTEFAEDDELEVALPNVTYFGLFAGITTH
jgi:hypothetical protein